MIFDLMTIISVFSTMEFNKIYIIIFIFFLAVLVNLPFGYARSKSKRYSLRWFLYIHIPIPLIVFIRIISHVEYKFIPVFVIASIIGQIIGSKIEL